ncbi:hypothetical protein GJ744_008520 [Endocarpon pusillum]|uniref:uS12 prolyl 3,4-dihydroxylase n=1 Tax=Endocarpon pusillum TaxID=364733 RepID=A0A8H7AIV7_9EURO|nr:hypothetical protein GJ744_008520 [Endocarpon pusillum]
MKRKYEAETSTSDGESQPFKKAHLSSTHTLGIHSHFHPALFEPKTLTTYQAAYQDSHPYRHGVIPALISDALLRSVRTEILTHISFTPKETDIYKIQQSGDLANLDGLDSAQLADLPSLVTLRDALYSAEFRAFLEDVTGAGKLSGKKTDMAINIYTPGSYLLCHDDVIGTRRVSYILYLTDPDEPWQAEWGGGLRLYATERKRNKRGEEVKVPLPEHVKVIPPTWGQLSFFAVQPGESFHDVEEVYHPPIGRPEEEKKRVRMAISGWYHIPQEGEDGYEEGLEQRLAERSSLSQLQGEEADEFDEPQPQFLRFDQLDKNHAKQDLEPDQAETADDDLTLLTEADLNLLLQYISPSYLTPEMTEQLASSFGDNSFLQLDRFLCDRFAGWLREFVSQHENPSLDANTSENKCSEWRTARPPHKHRFSFNQPTIKKPGSSFTNDPSCEDLPLTGLMTHLFPSIAFRKWLSIITGLTIDGDASFDILARRFSRGEDYALASAYKGENPRLEFSLGCTVSGKWQTGEAYDDDGHVNGNGPSAQANVVASSANGKTINGTQDEKRDAANRIEVGGEEIYMAGDDDDSSFASVKDGASPAIKEASRKSDPAIYKHDDENDAILFTDPPAWNRFSIVLRDRGTLRFVKYISAAAEGDRWDIKGVVEAGEGGWDENEEGEEGEGEEHAHENDYITESDADQDNQGYSSTE